MSEQKVRKESFEDVRITFKNFEGKKDTFNKNGTREFAILLDDFDRAQHLADIGWNVKFPKPNPELSPDEDTRVPYITVKVGVDGDYPPLINMVRNGRVIELDSDTVKTLDNARVLLCDIVISPYAWASDGIGTGSGISAYLSELWANVEDTGFAAKYGV